MEAQIYKCLDKIRDKNNKILEYVLIDRSGFKKRVEAPVLKNAIKQGTVKVVNLTLNSIGRLIDCSYSDEYAASHRLTIKKSDDLPNRNYKYTNKNSEIRNKNLAYALAYLHVYSYTDYGLCKMLVDMFTGDELSGGWWILGDRRIQSRKDVVKVLTKVYYDTIAGLENVCLTEEYNAHMASLLSSAKAMEDLNRVNLTILNLNENGLRQESTNLLRMLGIYRKELKSYCEFYHDGVTDSAIKRVDKAVNQCLGDLKNTLAARCKMTDYSDNISTELNNAVKSKGTWKSKNDYLYELQPAARILYDIVSTFGMTIRSVCHGRTLDNMADIANTLTFLRVATSTDADLYEIVKDQYKKNASPNEGFEEFLKFVTREEMANTLMIKESKRYAQALVKLASDKNYSDFYEICDAVLHYTNNGIGVIGVASKYNKINRKDKVVAILDNIDTIYNTIGSLGQDRMVRLASEKWNRLHGIIDCIHAVEPDTSKSGLELPNYSTNIRQELIKMAKNDTDSSVIK